MDARIMLVFFILGVALIGLVTIRAIRKTRKKEIEAFGRRGGP